MILVTGSEHSGISKRRERAVSKSLPSAIRAGRVGAYGASRRAASESGHRAARAKAKANWAPFAGGLHAAVGADAKSRGARALAGGGIDRSGNLVHKAGTTPPPAPAASAVPSRKAPAPPKLTPVPPTGAGSVTPPSVPVPGQSTIQKDSRPLGQQRRDAFIGGAYGGVVGAAALDHKHARRAIKQAGQAKHAVRVAHGSVKANAALIGTAALAGAAATQHERIGTRVHAARMARASHVLNSGKATS
jgi:hypothetical protein